MRQAGDSAFWLDAVRNAHLCLTAAMNESTVAQAEKDVFGTKALHLLIVENRARSGEHARPEGSWDSAPTLVRGMFPGNLERPIRLEKGERAMAVLGELLFYRRDQVGLDDVLRHQVDLLRGRVDELPDRLFAEKSDEEVAAHVAAKYAIEPLKIDLSAAKPSVEETQVEVHDRWGYDRGPLRIAGLRAKKSIPFTGEEDLWRLRTNPFSLNPPRGDVRGRTLIVGIEVAAQQADEAAKYIDDTIAQLPEYLQRQAAQLAPHNAGLAGNAMPWIKMRRTRLGTANHLLKKLGG